jgi:hypothetical protein
MAPEGEEQPPYLVEGTLTFSWYTKSEVKEYPSSHFTVRVDGAKWLIHEETEDKSAYDYNEVFCDGRYIYHTLSLKTAAEDRERHTGKREAPNIANCSLYEGHVFRNEFAHAVAPIWLAFASGDYWREVRGSLVEPVVTFTSKGPRSPSRGPEAFFGYNPMFQTAVWQCWPEFPHVPYAVTYFSGGFTNAIYIVEAVTNFGSTRLPLVASLTTFVDGQQAPVGQPPGILTRYRLSLGAVCRTESLTQQYPQLPGYATFSDYRFGKEAGMLQLAGTKWPSEQEARDSKEFNDGVKLVDWVTGHRGVSSSRLVSARIALLLIFLAPLFVMGARFLGKRKKQITST